MVKNEDYAEYSGTNADIEGPRNAAQGPLPTRVKEEDGQPSSSSCSLRLQFIGMGFSEVLVDKVLQQYGDDDSDTILEYLLSYPALQKSGSESSSLGNLFDSDNEDVSMLEPTSQNIKPEPDSFSEKRSYLLRIMNFSQQEVDFTLNMLGEEAPLEQLVDHIINAQSEGSSREKENDDDTTEGKAQSLFGVMDKTIGLLQMGFTEEEVSSAIDSSGKEATITDLADQIFARRIANSIEQKEVKVESDFPDETETSTYPASCFAVNYEDDAGYGREHTRVKRAKTIFVDDREASSSHSNNQRFMGSCSRMGLVKEEPEAVTLGCRTNVRGNVASPPYFVYGNVVEIPKDTWRQLTQFLYNVEPEFLNSQFFSALTRNEGYLHNLPMEMRSAVVPKSPMTIQEALSVTRKWWPSWDTRKHVSSVSLEASTSVGIEQTCERLGMMARESRGVLSQERQMHIVHQCKVSNLVWIGQNKLSPLEPHQVEKILGYPDDHTNLFGLSQQERFAALKCAFQTDTLAYLLSVLKDKFPDGIRVLSIYSGIGGAEVTLHRLGIHLKCVVSVEESDANRKILRRWWGKTKQAGVLRQYPGIWKLNTNEIENMIAEFGVFDLIIGGNYNSCKGGTTVSTTMGMNAQHFYEYARVVKRLRSAVGLD